MATDITAPRPGITSPQLRHRPPSPAPPRPGGVLLRHGVALSDAATNVLRALRVQIRQLADAGIVGIR